LCRWFSHVLTRFDPSMSAKQCCARGSHFAKLPNLINIENGLCMNYRSLIALTLCFILPLSLTQQSALADGVCSGIKAPILGTRSSEAAILGVGKDKELYT